jgi:succinate dehydrogenase assembly factor 1
MLSGVQQQTLSLYRLCLRAARARPSSDERAALLAYARAEFERHRGLKRSDTLRIEHLLRAGRKKLASLETASGISFVSPRSPTTGSSDR